MPFDKVHPDTDESRVLQAIHEPTVSEKVGFNKGPIHLQAKLKAQANFEDRFSAREKEKRKDDDDESRLTLRLNIPHILQKYLLDEGRADVTLRTGQFNSVSIR